MRRLEPRRLTDKLPAFIPAEVLAEPLARAKLLAEKMARVLRDEGISDAAIAVALLTSGVVNHYAGGPAKARELVDTIRRVEDRLLEESSDVGDLTLQ
jgi:hypothetical protein